MLKRFASADAPEARERAAKVALIADPPAGDPAELLRLTEEALSAGSNSTLVGWFRMAKGLAEYRAGRYAAAIGTIAGSRAVGAASAQATMDFLTAMAHHHLGQPDEAKRWLAQGAARMESGVIKPGDDSVESPENYMIAELMRREATRLVK